MTYLLSLIALLIIAFLGTKLWHATSRISALEESNEELTEQLLLCHLEKLHATAEIQQLKNGAPK